MQYGNGTLRLTTRQAYQLHGVLKTDLKTVFSSVIKNMGSTLGACGDVNRNVMGPSAPYKNRKDYLYAQQYAEDIADLLAPQSGAYYDVWLDGEKFVSVYKEVSSSSSSSRVTQHYIAHDFLTDDNWQRARGTIYGAQCYHWWLRCSHCWCSYLHSCRHS